MPQIITCPECGRKLRVPDNLLGKRVKCPGCGEKFVGVADEAQDDAGEAPAPSAAVTSRPGGGARRPDADEGVSPKYRVDEDEEDEGGRVPKRRRRDEDDDGGGRVESSRADVRQGWERVRFGINLVIVSVWVALGAAAVWISGWLLLALFGVATIGSAVNTVSTANGQPNQQQASQVFGQFAGMGAGMMVGGCLLVGLVGLLLLASVASRLTGYGFCMGVASTRKTQSLKGLAIAAFSVAVAALLVPMMSCGVNAILARAGEAPGCFLVVGEGFWWVLAMAELICFLLFLRGVAVTMRKEGLAANIIYYIIAVAIYIVMIPIGFVILVIGGMATVLGVASSASSASGPGATQAAVNNAANTMAGMAILGITCGGVLALLGLALFIWYVVLLYQARSAVVGWLDRN